MSIVNIFTRQAPTIAGLSFDAVLEDTLDVSVSITSYPIESGVRIADHRIFNPFKWTMTGAISNNPVKVQLTDLLGGALSNLTDNPVVSTAAGLSAGWLAGSDETRPSAALDMLLKLMSESEPFDIDIGEILLKNMAITRLSRTKEPRNESGLEFVAELQEVIQLDRLAAGEPRWIYQLRAGDPSQSALARAINKGQLIAKDTAKSVSKAVNGILDGII